MIVKMTRSTHIAVQLSNPESPTAETRRVLDEGETVDVPDGMAYSFIADGIAIAPEDEERTATVAPPVETAIVKRGPGRPSNRDR